MMIHFWQRDRSSAENSATFRTQTCAGCHRPYYPEMVDPARPICILPSYDEKQIVDHIAEGQPILDTLPEWDPVGCSELFPTTDPVLHLKMDDNEANPIVHDVRGIYPQTFLDAAGNPNTNAHSATGHVGTSLSFDGVDDYIELSTVSWHPYLAANTDFSICMWLRPFLSPGTPYKNWLGNSGPAPDGTELFEITSSVRWSCRWTWTGGTYYTEYNIGWWGANLWGFIGMARSGTTLRFQVNNNNMGGPTNSAISRTLVPAGRPFRIARGSANNTYKKMCVDDFRLYSYDIGAAGMLAIYNGTM